MARIEWVHYRLQLWQRWVLTRGGGKLGYAAVDLLAGPRAEGLVGASVVPNDAIEASQTHTGVMSLPRELMATVVEYYIAPGSERAKCERLAIHKSTFHARLEQADARLQAALRPDAARPGPEDLTALVEFIDRVEVLVGGVVIADAAAADVLTPEDTCLAAKMSFTH